MEDFLSSHHVDHDKLHEWQLVRDEAVEYLRKDVSRKDHLNWSSALSSNDARSLWMTINWKGSFASAEVGGVPELDDLAAHFAAKGQAGRDSSVLCEVTGDNYVPALDDDITLDEIVTAQNELKDKSSGDGWCKKMVTSFPAPLLLLLQLIYNTILKFHIFPTAWRTTVVGEIFKNKGLRDASKNYRGISLVQLLAKLFDIVLLKRFKKWFKPADEQTAYQAERGSPDHVFLLRCMTQHAKRFNEKIFMIAIDFDGAFDRVCRSLLIRKLCLFGAGAVFTACLASIYMSTDNIIFRGKSHVTYKLYSGIKQGLPLSPLLFLFYINDVFDFLGAIYDGGKQFCDLVHILIHADDATIIASDRTSAINKLRSMLKYCDLNYIIPQFTKCEFLVVNGTEEDREPLPFGKTLLKNVEYIILLGSHLTSAASLFLESQLHMLKRYISVIKYYNFIRSNRLAPLKVKIKVLQACVMSSLLHNCEAFGNIIPSGLESTYVKMLKCCFNVRSNVPNDILYIESGFLPIKAIIHMRQYNFYKRFRKNLKSDSRRGKMMEVLLEKKTNFLQHYEKLVAKYASSNEILAEYSSNIQQKIHKKANAGRYKFQIYVKMNPELSISPFLNIVHPVAGDITKFRLGSHYLPIETGRWSRKLRNERLCMNCGVLGDEEHVLYSCTLISREDVDLENISKLWHQPEIYKLFTRIKDAKFL